MGPQLQDNFLFQPMCGFFFSSWGTYNNPNSNASLSGLESAPLTPVLQLGFIFTGVFAIQPPTLRKQWDHAGTTQRDFRLVYTGTDREPPQ